MAGQRVCRKHGGKAPQNLAAAERRVQERAAGELLERLLWNVEAAPVTDSVGEMRRLAGSMRQAADVLGARLNGSPETEPCEECGRGPVSAEPLDGTTGTAWVRVLRELRQLLADMERLGIANRAMELEREQVEVMYAAYVAALDAVPELLPEQRNRQLLAFLTGLGVSYDVVAGELTA